MVGSKNREELLKTIVTVKSKNKTYLNCIKKYDFLYFKSSILDAVGNDSKKKSILKLFI